jgi:hypothetical protein
VKHLKENPPENPDPLLIYDHNHPDVQNAGQADLVQNKRGNTQDIGYAPLGRECCFTPDTSETDQWPVFNAKQPLELQVSTSLLPLQ